MRSALDELLDEYPLTPRFRCSVRYRGLRCSLDEGHGGRHEALYADQERKQPVVAAVEEVAPPVPSPRGPSFSPTLVGSSKSHHLEHPGAWLPQAHLDADEPGSDEWWENIPEEELLPHERQIRRSKEAVSW